MKTFEDGLVSIITPMYNSEKFISETIESVISQTYINWEMIIVDDLSTDKSRSIAESYAKKDQRIKVIGCDHKSANGPIEVRNKAINEAQGQYIALLDSDDCWDKEKLEKQIAFMESHKVAFVISNYRIYNDMKQKIVSVFKAPPRIDYRGLCKVNSIGCLTVIYDASKIGKVFIVDATNREDHATWLNILQKTDYAYTVGECLATYRVHNNSFSSQNVKLIKYQWRVYRKNEGFGVIKSLYYLLNTIIRKLFKY